MASATALLELGAPPAALVEAEGRHRPEAERLAQARPEVLLVHDAEGHLPAVGRGEEAVPGDGRRPG